jgi:hypothetical protein
VNDSENPWVKDPENPHLIDAIGEIDGQRFLIDWKTTANCS